MRAIADLDDPDVEDGVCYPAEDGEPMGETGFQVNAILALYGILTELYKSRSDIYVAGDMFWYWEKGNPSACCAPDVMVIPGARNEVRRSFRGWNENDAVPAVIFEMASKKTWRRNLGALYQTYERLGVKEYFLFDPERKYLDPIFQGFRLRKRKYSPIRPGRDGSLTSAELGLRMIPEGIYLQLTDARTGERILDDRERAEQERQRAEQEHQRAEQERQRAEQERQRAEQEHERAEQERQRAEQERQRAEQERQRADSLEAEVARLRTQVANKGKPNGPKPGK